MNLRKIVIGAAVVVIGLPVALVLIAGLSFYALMSFYALNRTRSAEWSIVSAGFVTKRETPRAPRRCGAIVLEVMGLGRVELPTSRLSGSFIRT